MTLSDNYIIHTVYCIYIDEMDKYIYIKCHENLNYVACSNNFYIHDRRFIAGNSVAKLGGTCTWFG